MQRTLDAEANEAIHRAMEHVRALHPDALVNSARLRADEPERYVFAVFYAARGVYDVPGRYQLVAVARIGGAVTELETTWRSPYWIKGLK